MQRRSFLASIPAIALVPELEVSQRPVWPAPLKVQAELTEELVDLSEKTDPKWLEWIEANGLTRKQFKLELFYQADKPIQYVNYVNRDWKEVAYPGGVWRSADGGVSWTTTEAQDTSNVWETKLEANLSVWLTRYSWDQPQEIFSSLYYSLGHRALQVPSGKVVLHSYRGADLITPEQKRQVDETFGPYSEAVVRSALGI